MKATPPIPNVRHGRRLWHEWWEGSYMYNTYQPYTLNPMNSRVAPCWTYNCSLMKGQPRKESTITTTLIQRVTVFKVRLCSTRKDSPPDTPPNYYSLIYSKLLTPLCSNLCSYFIVKSLILCLFTQNSPELPLLKMFWIYQYLVNKYFKFHNYFTIDNFILLGGIHIKQGYIKHIKQIA